MSEDTPKYEVNLKVYPEVTPEGIQQETFEELLSYDEKMMDLYLTLDQLDEDISSLRELIVELEQLKENVEVEIEELKDN